MAHAPSHEHRPAHRAHPQARLVDVQLLVRLRREHLARRLAREPRLRARPRALGAARVRRLRRDGPPAWTLVEWLLHRYVYHLWTSFLTEGHALHHEKPRALIGVPWYLTTIVVVLAFELLALPLRPSSTGVVMGFAWLGYIFYCVAHHGSHHWRFPNGGSRR